jgi:hypothetical protein
MQTSIVQSILFHRSLYTLNQAREWLTRHRYKSNNLDITNNYFRFRQHEPSSRYRYRIKQIAPGILFIFGFPKSTSYFKPVVKSI